MAARLPGVFSFECQSTTDPRDFSLDKRPHAHLVKRFPTDPALQHFLDPVLPVAFTLVGDQGGCMGPFRREDIIHEADGALVFYEDGSLPMRIGVVGQQGDRIDLYPEGQLRVVAVNQPGIRECNA